eukprot:CAMPEP_0113238404 /NCGR_PEP_ID=MMETSP0008_2-20120614/5132_1 /TAXON_ID=97485 /ORGANISM="Prymnesium parvum" /LENGTH=144 /DNA_ID=CAMNT_0000085517 /DNA_START=410 /DNA_END=843 /DNA_ORIENTATION=+ /assembly_acc=CAM_ASM_000153
MHAPGERPALPPHDAADEAEALCMPLRVQHVVRDGGEDGHAGAAGAIRANGPVRRGPAHATRPSTGRARRAHVRALTEHRPALIQASMWSLAECRPMLVPVVADPCECSCQPCTEPCDSSSMLPVIGERELNGMAKSQVAALRI